MNTRIYTALLVGLSVILSFPTLSQKINVDSLKQIWTNDKIEDTVRCDAVNKIAGLGFLRSNTDSAYYYAQQGLEFAKERNLQRQTATALNMLGLSSEARGDYLHAIEYHSRSLKINRSINYRKGIAASLNNIGILFEIQENYSQAQENYLLFLDLMKQEGDQWGIAISYNNIGNIYLLQEDYEKALTYYEKSLVIGRELSDQQGISISLNNIGQLYILQKKYPQALNQFEKSISEGENINDRGIRSSSLNAIGHIHIVKNDFAKAISYVTDALEIAQEVGNVEKIRDASKNLYQIHKELKNEKMSLQMHELYIEMRDSLLDRNAQKEVIRQEFEYTYEKQALADSISFVKQQEIDALSQRDADNKRYAIYIGLAILLCFVGVYLRMRSIKSKTEKKELLQEIKILKSEAIIKVASSVTDLNHLPLDREKIAASIDGSLNQSDWNILTALYQNPTISNREIAEKVSLSMSGVHSSLRKMYRIFDLNNKTENQRITLVVRAVKLSNKSV